MKGKIEIKPFSLGHSRNKTRDITSKQTSKKLNFTNLSKDIIKLIHIRIFKFMVLISNSFSNGFKAKNSLVITY